MRVWFPRSGGFEVVHDRKIVLRWWPMTNVIDGWIVLLIRKHWWNPFIPRWGRRL